MSLNSCLVKKERCLNFRQPDEIFKMSDSPYFVDVELLQIEKNRIILCYVFFITKMLLNIVLNITLNSATARQFQATVFKILRVQYRISSILNQSVHNIRLIECYLVPDHQEVVKYLYSLTFTMQISTIARQTSNCMQIITYHVASFRTNYFQNSSCPTVSYFLDFE